MQGVAHWALLLSLIGLLIMAGVAAWNLWNREAKGAPALEAAQGVLFCVLTVVSLVLLAALWRRDFSYEYVFSYTDKVLPAFYAVTAFWAGQAGSLLFWVWVMALFGLLFSLTKKYKRLAPETKFHFWLFFLSIEAFFLLLLTGPSNPFLGFAPGDLPPDGKGLNPLLQNPGMIFHPPLLFAGYAGFAVPACLALASWLSGEPTSWLKNSRAFTILSWMFLTAGIILGCWWSYMELGWGGYWAWDPVENASLIPWLAATAFIHTAVIETRRGSLKRTNVILVSLTLLLSFFATYLVRGAVVESLHAFGEGGVGGPLLVFTLAGLLLTIVIAVVGSPSAGPRPMSEPVSLPGMLLALAVFLLALAVVVFMGTLWPVFSKLWSENPVGLGADFYNRVCTPLFALIGVFLAFCPHMSWKAGVARPKTALVALGAFLVAGVATYFLGYKNRVALVGIAAGFGALISLLVLLSGSRAARSLKGGLGAWLLHIGLALVFIGVAFSGPYQLSKQAIVAPEQTMEIGGYTLTYKGVKEFDTPGYKAGQATIVARRGDKVLGELTPERRTYKNFPQPFAEVSVIPSLGEELYSTLLAYSTDQGASIEVRVNPLVSWFWVGGTLMCLSGILCLLRATGRED